MFNCFRTVLFSQEIIQIRIETNISNQHFFIKIQSIRKQDENQLDTHKCVSKCEVYIFFCDAAKNLEKSPKIQSKFAFMNEQVPEIFISKIYLYFNSKFESRDWNSKQDKIIL